jgi:SAM-dependent methyltransferase
MSLTDQKAIYDQHHNDPSDPGYLQFLSRFTDALIPHLSAHAYGLDYGCGPGPALGRLLATSQRHLALYDPIYYPNPETLTAKYDFVTATEVVEHFSDTGEEMTRIWSLVKPGGWLGIMTKRVSNPEAFKTWHYIRDPTHLSFFSEKTFTWLAKYWQASLTLPAADVALLQKTL